ncbi:methyltransferase domain-containing protein [Shewanella japonica]|uniref:SAM-dependent methyltransferase n=1 Tax=Shewanella japonica TaxID=93973 RepID=A0ABM6JKR9_9GAMM|nr:methyltransferase domain-containing protein [Shewanella japonica]ARD21995.1 SAM-dependent methyltransferase [Shewanella japonica]
MTFKNPVAEKFSQAAKCYKQHDVLQRRTAEKLLTHQILSGDIVDIGCGPGTDFTLVNPQQIQIKQVMAVDLSSEMLAMVKQDFPDYHTLCADAAALPLSANQFNGLYSNLVLQWCEDLPAVLSEFYRILKPGAHCLISIVSAGSLPELSKLGLGHNDFSHFDDIVAQANKHHWQIENAEHCSESLYFTDLRTLLYSIKGVGASVKSHQQTQSKEKQGSVSLRGRQDWLALTEKAESLRVEQGIPLTYQITYLHLIKK